MNRNRDPKRFTVGDRVVITGVNRRQPADGEVVKVGRTLVHVREGNRHRAETYLIADGVRNDNYRHDTVWTLDEYAERARRAAITDTLNDELGVHLRPVRGGYTRYTVDQLERLADFVTALQKENP